MLCFYKKQHQIASDLLKVHYFFHMTHLSLPQREDGTVVTFPPGVSELSSSFSIFCILEEKVLHMPKYF